MHGPASPEKASLMKMPSFTSSQLPGTSTGTNAGRAADRTITGGKATVATQTIRPPLPKGARRILGHPRLQQGRRQTHA